MGGSNKSSAFWAVLALGAVGLGIGVAFLAGILIGNLTDDTKTSTTTLVSAQPPGGEGEIPTAPAFTAEELAAEPRENWITNGGSTSNARYSPLDEINTDNVDELKGVWHANLGSAVATKYSAETQPIVYEGVMYVSTGANDVFAFDVKNGKQLWKYEAHLEEEISTVCCGWTNRGVAIGEGMVFNTQLNGELVALDMQTGEVVWRTAVGKWQNGETITSAPLYYDGRVYAGLSGGEFGIRGRLSAYDAKTGELEWKFWTIPGPGETGHDTWPQNNDAWKSGGAPVWNTPAVDPELNMLYFSTGNASPDVNGSGRPGENLFATAIVAIDATTGDYKWHFQQVHHDIWDYDAPSPVVLWDTEIDGEEVKGISEPGKTGWLYMLDRETGEPIHGIEERPVPQNKAEQATWPTQPYPSTPPFMSHEVTAKQAETIEEIAKETYGDKVKVRKGEIFDPFGKEMTVIAPGPSGGTNWPPSSFNPDTNDVYICGIQGFAGFMTEGLERQKKQSDVWISSVMSLIGFGSYDGLLTAQDVTTGEIEWQKKFPAEACYSGTVTTAGGLVFSGRSNGELVAYDAETGEELWAFQTGAGANNTPTIFEIEGKQHIAFYAGGNSLAGSAQGDELWVFSLDGKLGPVAAPGGGEQGQHAGQETEPEGEVEESEGASVEEEEARGTEAAEEEAERGGKEEQEAEMETSGDPAAGKSVFAENCSICHGADGGGGNGGPPLTTGEIPKDLQATVEQVTSGGTGMPAFAETLSTKEIEDVAAFVVETINK